MIGIRDYLYAAVIAALIGAGLWLHFGGIAEGKRERDAAYAAGAQKQKDIDDEANKHALDSFTQQNAALAQRIADTPVRSIWVRVPSGGSTSAIPPATAPVPATGTGDGSCVRDGTEQRADIGPGVFLLATVVEQLSDEIRPTQVRDSQLATQR